MIAPRPTREVIADLQAAGWTKARQTGSHGRWVCPTGVHFVSGTDGHRTTSAGVVRKVERAISNCNCGQEEEQ